MKFGHCLIDRKIMGINIAASLTIADYLDFVPRILGKNEFQRNAVRASGKTYDLLRRDLLNGCVIPPIILAVTDRYGEELSTLVSDAITNDLDEVIKECLFGFLELAAQDGELLILGGLQRTLTLLSITQRSDYASTPGLIETFLKQELRI